MSSIYGVDTSQPVTPTNVRDAIIACFTQAHSEESGILDTSLNKLYCRTIVEKMMTDNQTDFAKPTKSDLQKLIPTLIAFSQNFRDPSVVTRHANEIQELLDLLP